MYHLPSLILLFSMVEKSDRGYNIYKWYEMHPWCVPSNIRPKKKIVISSTILSENLLYAHALFVMNFYSELPGVSLENFAHTSPPDICHHSSVAECSTLLCVQLCFTVAKPGHPLWMICSACSLQTELWFAGSAGWSWEIRSLQWTCLPS